MCPQTCTVHRVPFGPSRAERGAGSFEATLEGVRWLASNGFRLSAAGRAVFEEDECTARAGFAALFADLGADIPAGDPSRLVIFPEMDPAGDPPEITTACWDILGKRPEEVFPTLKHLKARA